MYNELGKKRKMVVLAGILTGMLLSSLDSMIVSTALPKILASLGGIEHFSWTFTAYMLTSTIAIPIFGKLADIYGRKPFYLGGIIVFLTGSALCGTSNTMTQLILFRALQGVGGGIMMSNSMAIVADIFPPAERGKYQGLMGGVFGLSSVIGPALGGYITDYWNWHWVFWVNIPVGVIAIAILAVGLPYLRPVKRSSHIDYLGVALIIIAFTPLLLALTWAGTQYAWGSIQIVGLFAFSFIMLLLFGWVETRAEDPIVPLTLFQNRIFNVAVFTGFFMSTAMFGTIMFIPLFMQGVIGSSATDSGVVTTPMMLSLVVGSTLSGQITSRTGRYKILGLIGFAVMFAGMVLLTRMGLTTHSGTVVRNVMVVGMGLGITMPVFVIAAQNAFPHPQVGVVTAAVQFFRNIGGTVGVAIMGSLLNLSFRRAALHLIPDVVQQLIPPSLKNMLVSPQTLFAPEVMDKIRNILPPQGVALFTKLLTDIKGALVTALQDVFKVGAIVIFAALIATFFLKEIPLRKSIKPTLGEAGSELLAGGGGVLVEGGVFAPEDEPEL